MPHRVTNFLRTSSGSIPHIKSKKKPSTGSSSSSRNNSISDSAYASDSDDHVHVVKMPDLADALKKHHRLSLPFGRSSRDHRHSQNHHHLHLPHHPWSSSSSSSTVVSHPPLTLSWSIESPPIVFHGTPTESTGALVSGQLLMDVKEECVRVERFEAQLAIHVTHRRPFQNHCLECQTRTTELKSWRFLAHPASLCRGRHLFPFSALLEGHLPASTDTPAVCLVYEFKAEVYADRGRGPGSGSGTGSGSSSSSVLVPGSAPCPCLVAQLERSLDVKRSLPEPLYPHHSVRVFPPTNIKASAHYNSVIHPTCTNKLTLRLDGLMTRNEKVKTVDLWRLRKVTWKLEETIKATAPACEKHAPAEDSEAKKAILRTETRTIGEKQLHDGWKSDFSGVDGTVEMEFDYGVNQCKPHSRDLKYACDMKTDDGIEVTHALFIELIVSKEYAPEGKPQLATQTGTGRVLRMHFSVVLTEFSGLGVSWDNEAPPVYEDVPPSPPGYPLEEGRGPPMEYDDLEELDAQRPSAETIERAPTESEGSR